MTADRPAGHSRTAAGTGWACCSSAAPGVAHSHVDASADAAAEASTGPRQHQAAPVAVDPASETTIPTDCYAPQ